MEKRPQARFFKGLLLVTTLTGVVIGLHEAWRLAGGMVVLVAMQILIMGIAACALVQRIRKENQ